MHFKIRMIPKLCWALMLVSLSSYAWTVEDKEISISDTFETQVQPMEAPKALLRPAQNVRASKGETLKLKTAEGETAFSKTPVPLTDEEEAVADYSHALELIAAGKDGQAMRLLEKSLSVYPRHIATRTELARLYLKNSRELDAELILLEGLKFAGQQPGFLKLMAVVSERRGEAEKALEYLSKIPADHKNEKETLALFGHIYQRTGYYSRARQHYQRLLQMDPYNPLWKLGYTIAVDSEGKKDEALEGYRRLQSDGMIEPQLLKYIEQRMAELKG